MKRICLIIVLVLSFINVNATSINNECDYKREVELNKLAGKITYDREYNSTYNTYKINLYNVTKDMHLVYNGLTLYGNDDEEVSINNIHEGEYMNIVVYSNSGSCYSSLMTIYITIPYYNTLYDSAMCKDYKNILTQCSNEYLSYKINEKILNDAIDNYKTEVEKKEIEVDIIEEDDDLLESIKEFGSKWGIKIILSIVTSLILIWIYKIKVRKMIHKI